VFSPSQLHVAGENTFPRAGIVVKLGIRHKAKVHPNHISAAFHPAFLVAGQGQME